MNGSYITSQYAFDNPAPANKEFVASYKAHYEGLEPDALAALGYDALKLFADAVKQMDQPCAKHLQERRILKA